jgi:hypothetical protein
MKKRVLDGSALLFALSHDDELRDVVARGQEAGNARLQLAFYRAEKLQ